MKTETPILKNKSSYENIHNAMNPNEADFRKTVKKMYTRENRHFSKLQSKYSKVFD
jgi:rubrerythrin